MGTLDPDMQAILEMMRENPAPPVSVLTPAEARRNVAALFTPFWNADAPPLPRIEDSAVPGPAGPIPVRLYDPGLPPGGPGLVYLHGGGWVICDRASHDGVCRRLARSGRLRVVSVDYRLAPEHKFPAPLEDCIAAARAVAAEGGRFGIDPARLAIGGDSAGANLSLATLLALRDQGGPACRAGLLVYGAYGLGTDTDSQRAFGDGRYLLSTADMRWFLGHYIDGAATADDPRVSPIRADLAGLPPLFLTAAAFDPLLDESLALSEKLSRAGQPHIYRLWPGVVHAALHMTRMLPAMEGYIAEMGEWLGRTLRA
jgi:acetyl esterase